MSSAKRAKTHRDLDIYRIGFETAMKIFQASKGFPKEERYFLTDQIRRSSGAVCTNLAEAWRKRRYESAFVSKLNDVEAEAAETQSWLEFAVQCEYLAKEPAREFYRVYDRILGVLVGMINFPETWLLTDPRKRRK